MVTKQQQLEWLEKHFDLDSQHINYVIMSGTKTGLIIGWGTSTSPESSALSTRRHIITREEWQQERDKMQKQPVQPAQPAPDNAWHERGEFPPAGCECEVLHRGKWIKTVIIGMSPYKSCVYSLIGSGSDYAYDGIANSHFFRPIRTEREKAIDEMILAIDHIKEGNFETFIGALYDAGYRKVNP